MNELLDWRCTGRFNGVGCYLGANSTNPSTLLICGFYIYPVDTRGMPMSVGVRSHYLYRTSLVSYIYNLKRGVSFVCLFYSFCLVLFICGKLWTYIASYIQIRIPNEVRKAVNVINKRLGLMEIESIMSKFASYMLSQHDLPCPRNRNLPSFHVYSKSQTGGVMIRYPL
jgi:hypothetical protein